jgi:fumarate hydratase subunit alpha
MKRFVLETVINSGGKPCPPIGLGIGIGGQMDVAAKLSRVAQHSQMG